MKLTLLSVMLTTSLVAGTSSALSAQSKTIPGETTTITATVEAIDATTRTLTVKGERGTSCRSWFPNRWSDSLKSRWEIRSRRAITTTSRFA